MTTRQPGPGLGRRRDPRLNTQEGGRTEALPRLCRGQPGHRWSPGPTMRWASAGRGTGLNRCPFRGARGANSQVKERCQGE